METQKKILILPFFYCFKAKELNKYSTVDGIAGCISLPQNARFSFFTQILRRSFLCLTLLLSATAGNIYAQSYCASAGSIGQDIFNVNIGTLNNSSNCNQAGGTGSVSNKYSNYTSVTAPALPQLNPIPFSIEVGSCTNYSETSTSIWIDYNHNGSFDAPDERVYNSGSNFSSAYTIAGTIIIPESALKGNTRMRVITISNASIPHTSACGIYSKGETEDYTVNIVGPVFCSGVPAPGNTIASQSTVCVNTNIDLSFSSSSALNNSNAVGFTYQWFNNTGAIVGANNPTYTATITTADNFYCKVTCTKSGQTGQSTPVAIGLKPLDTCYCISTANSTAGLDIFNVTAGTLNHSTNGSQTGGPGSILNSYSNFTTLVAAPVFNQLATIPCSVRIGTNSDNSQTSIWIDYNHNGTFENPGERAYQTTGSNFGNYTTSGFFTIPITSLTGITRMRVIASAGTTPVNSACENYSQGETEDYFVNIIAPPACSGSPVPTNTIATQHPVCPEAKYTFSLSPSIITTGNTYQWYNDAGLIAGATNETYTTTISNADNFYCKITCPNGNKTTTSIPVAALKCYCSSMAIGNADLEILNVTAGTLNHTTNGSQTGGPGSVLNSYSDFTTIVAAPEFNQLATIPVSVKVGGSTFYSQTSIWVDYNHDGTFESPGERVYQTTGSNFGNYTANGFFTIPVISSTGITRMRVITSYGSTKINSACENYNQGETEDYLVNILAPPACSGTPIPTTTVATQNPVCPQISFTFSLSPSIITAGNTYQWYNNAGLIAGATNETYTATITTSDNFYCKITCPDGAKTTTSTPAAIHEPYLYCPCISTAKISDFEDIFNVTIGTLNNSSNCNQTGGPGSDLNKYSDYTTLVDAPDLPLLSAIPYSITTTGCGGYGFTSTSIWIDFNHNGVFDAPGERVFSSGNYPFLLSFTESGSFVIPAGSLPGLTRMRIISAEKGGLPIGSACGEYSVGETEDYFVNIIVPVCSDTPTAGTTVVSQNNVCANTSVTLSISSPPAITNGINYKWFKNGSAITGATDATYTTTITTTGNFYCEVTCTNSALTASSTPVNVNVTQVSLPTAATINSQNVAAMPLVANDCLYIARLVPTTGFTDATIKSWIETTPPFIYVPRHFEITPGTNPNTATGTVTLYFSQADFNAYNGTINTGLLPTGPNDISGIANLQILKYSGTSPTGLGYSGSPTFIPDNGNSWNTGDYIFIWNEINSIWEVTFPVSGFSGFLAKSIAQPLPVTLIFLTGKATEKGNELNWKTSSETNFSHFEIYRSLNAKAYEKIGKQVSIETGNYTFLDSTSFSSNAYYRLKMIDRDGKYNFSKIISIKNNEEKAIVGNFYPNPSISKAFIEINATEKGIWNITTYDINGNIISFKSKLLQIGLNKISIDKLNQGLNFVRFDNGIVSEIRKVIRE